MKLKKINVLFGQSFWNSVTQLIFVCASMTFSGKTVHTNLYGDLQLTSISTCTSLQL